MELIAKAFDRELWQRGDDVVCVQRPRTGSVSAAALALTFGGFAALGALTTLGVIVFAGERGGWIVSALVLGVLAAVLLVLGGQHLAKDRAIRAMPISEVPHVVIANGDATFSDGTQVPAREVYLEVEAAEYGDADRLELVLHARERRVMIFFAGREPGLDTAREVLRRAGLGVDRYRKKT